MKGNLVRLGMTDIAEPIHCTSVNGLCYWVDECGDSENKGYAGTVLLRENPCLMDSQIGLGMGCQA